MNKEKVIRWIKAAGLRALRTFCQVAGGTIGTSLTLGEVDWVFVISSSLLAAILSLLMSIGGLPELGE